MAKSRRTCYFTNYKDLWDKDRPGSAYYSCCKSNKVMSHRIERAWKAERIHRELVQLGYR